MLLFVDGCGVNHPRMAGLACYVGIILGVPTIGISKDALCGEYGNFLEKKKSTAAGFLLRGNIE